MNRFIIFLLFSVLFCAASQISNATEESKYLNIPENTNFTIWSCQSDPNITERHYNPDISCYPNDSILKPIGYSTLKTKNKTSGFAKFLSALEEEKTPLVTYYAVRLSNNNKKSFYGIEIPYTTDSFVKAFKKTKCSDYLRCDYIDDWTRMYKPCTECPNKDGNATLKYVYGYSLESFAHAEQIAQEMLENGDINEFKELR